MIGTAIKSILETASIEAKIYGLHVPRRRGASWVIYTGISRIGNKTKDGVSTLDRYRFQIDCYAKTESAMDTLGEAVKSALDNYSGTVEGTVIDHIAHEGESDTVEIITDEGAQEEFYRRIQEYLLMIQI